MKFICDVCGKSFDKNSQLNGHKSHHKRSGLRVLPGDKERVCLGCGKSFTQRTTASQNKNQKFCSMSCYREYQKSKKLRFNVRADVLAGYKLKQKSCEICGKVFTQQEFEQAYFDNGKKKMIRTEACLDHNHKTGNFRGLLCQSCNRNLGWFEEREKEVREYLSAYNNFDNVLAKVR